MIVNIIRTLHPHSLLFGTNALVNGELVLSSLFTPKYVGSMSFLSMGDCLNLSGVMTKQAIWLDPVKAYDDPKFSALYEYLYSEKGDSMTLRRVMK